MSIHKTNVAAVVLLLVAAGSCNCDRQQEILPEKPAASGITPADASSDGKVEIDGAVESDGTVEDGKPQHSGCPTNLPGPPMVEISANGSPAYCIDSREVSQGEYFEFLNAYLENPAISAKKKEGVGDWPAVAGCKWNLSLMPAYGAEPCYSQAPHAFSQGNKYPSFPMACLNWCSAYSYCLWAGKRLCGKIGGGSLKASEVTDPTKAEWYNVCTQGGKSVYGYGDVFNPDLPSPDHPGATGWPLPADSPSQCRGSLPPFDKIEGIGCNVAEWQDACETTPTATLCSVQIVSAGGLPKEPRCDYHVETGQQPDPQIGFRCCHD